MRLRALEGPSGDARGVSIRELRIAQLPIRLQMAVANQRLALVAKKVISVRMATEKIGIPMVALKMPKEYLSKCRLSIFTLMDP